MFERDPVDNSNNKTLTKKPTPDNSENLPFDEVFSNSNMIKYLNEARQFLNNIAHESSAEIKFECNTNSTDKNRYLTLSITYDNKRLCLHPHGGISTFYLIENENPGKLTTDIKNEITKNNLNNLIEIQVLKRCCYNYSIIQLIPLDSRSDTNKYLALLGKIMFSVFTYDGKTISCNIFEKSKPSNTTNTDKSSAFSVVSNFASKYTWAVATQMLKQEQQEKNNKKENALTILSQRPANK